MHELAAAKRDPDVRCAARHGLEEHQIAGPDLVALDLFPDEILLPHLARKGERAFLAEHGDIPVRATGSYIGHGMEPVFPMNVALAALTLSRGSLFPPLDASGFEKPMSGPLRQAIVTGVGYWRGEGMALVEAA